MTLVHDMQHPLAGQDVQVVARGGFEPVTFRVGDWCDRVFGMTVHDDPPVEAHFASGWQYLLRMRWFGIPDDDDVVYGLVGPFASLVHVTELHPELARADADAPVRRGAAGRPA